MMLRDWLSTTDFSSVQASLKGAYLEGHGELVSRLILGITRGTKWVIGVNNLPTTSP